MRGPWIVAGLLGLALAASAEDAPPDVGGALERTVRRAVARIAPSVCTLEVERREEPPTPPVAAPDPVPPTAPTPSPEPAPPTAPKPPPDRAPTPPTGPAPGGPGGPGPSAPPSSGPGGAGSGPKTPSVPTPAPEAKPAPQLRPDAWLTPDTPPTYFRRPDGPVSAVVVDADGGLCTSAWAVAGPVVRITAVFPDGRRLPATLVGTAPDDDLAYLRVEADGLAAAPLATEPPRVGQFVVAVGAVPTSPTATVGIVSAAARLRTTSSPTSREGTALQVSARLNYGNSGGAVVSLDGTLVGIAGHVTHDVRAPEARHGQNSGVGFAVPASRLRELLPRLRAGETIAPRPLPFLGVQTSADPKGEGARVEVVVPDSPAERAGLKPGDVIIRVGESRVESPLDLMAAMQQAVVADVVDVVLLRGEPRTRVECKATLVARPKDAR